MKLKTLNYIHELLIKNVAAAKEDWLAASDKKHKAKNEDKEDYSALRKISFGKLDSLKDAEEALKAFEEQEW